jgi:multiple sugar transport system permease protein
MRRTKKRFSNCSVAFLIGVVIVSPILWTLLSSLKPETEILKYPPTIFPREFVLTQYMNLLADTHFLSFFWNSLAVGLITTPLTLLIAAPGAYSLTRFKYRGRNVYSIFLLFSYMVPLLLIGIPMFIIMAYFGILNTKLSLVISYVAFCLPFSMWMLRSFFLSIPVSLEESAMVDGANRLQALILIVLPLAKPGLIACGIFTFVLVWNEYTLALLFISSENLKTLPVGVAAFIGQVAAQWGYILPAIILMVVPMLFFFAFVQKSLVRGFLTGATKG